MAAPLLAPLAVMAAGKIGSNLIGKRKKNQEINYAEKQRNLDYEDDVRAGVEMDDRKIDGIDYLQAISQSRGYRIPTGAFEALKRFKGRNVALPASQRFAKAPRSGLLAAIGGPLAEGVTEYGKARLGKLQANDKSITDAIVQGVKDGKISPDILCKMGIIDC